MGLRMSMAKKIGLWGLMSLLLSGCVGLQQSRIALPPPTASIKERMEAYQEFRAVVIRRTFHETRYSVQEWNYLRLNNGLVFYHPAELIPLVGLNTPTADAARLYAEYKSKERSMFWISFAIGTVGTTLALIPTVMPDRYAAPDYSIVNHPLFWTGLVVTSLSALSMALAYPIFGSTAAMYQRKAFRLYNHDLRKRLGLGLIPHGPQGGPVPPPGPQVPPTTPQPPTSPQPAPPSQDNGPQPPEPPAEPTPAPQRIQTWGSFK